MAKYCANCGNELNGSEKFCTNCGVPVAKEDLMISERDNTPQAQNTSADLPVLKNGKAWSLAIVPFLALWIFSDLLGADYSITTSLIVLALIFIDVHLDIKELRAAGYSTDGWGWTGYLITPVYLFIRASKTDKKYGYAIMWCVMFVANLFLSGAFTPVVYITAKIR